MNIKRGLFRIWLVCSIIFVVFVFYNNAKIISHEFEQYQLEHILKTDILLLPYDCKSARGEIKIDYTEDAYHRCWYGAPKFRALFPEYANMSDDELSNMQYPKFNMEIHNWHPSPAQVVAKTAAIAFGAPLSVLVLGMALLWAFAGFASTNPN